MVSFRAGVTTLVDAGTSGWRTFSDFREHVIARAATRVLAMLNIVGSGMGSGSGENNPDDMDPEAAAKTARANADRVVGFKSAHYAGPGWFSIDNAVKAGALANVPVMVDFGQVTAERNLDVLLHDKLRPGDIYTHCYSGHRDELLHEEVNPAMEEFYPDSISTDVHLRGINAGMKDMVQTMSKILNLGAPLEEVIRLTTVNPAK